MGTFTLYTGEGPELLQESHKKSQCGLGRGGRNAALGTQSIT